MEGHACTCSDPACHHIAVLLKSWRMAAYGRNWPEVTPSWLWYPIDFPTSRRESYFSRESKWLAWPRGKHEALCQIPRNIQDFQPTPISGDRDLNQEPELTLCPGHDVRPILTLKGVLLSLRSEKWWDATNSKHSKSESTLVPPWRFL